MRVANRLINSQSNWLCHLQRVCSVAINSKLNRSRWFLFHSTNTIDCVWCDVLFESIHHSMNMKLQLMIDKVSMNPLTDVVNIVKSAISDGN